MAVLSSAVSATDYPVSEFLFGFSVMVEKAFHDSNWNISVILVTSESCAV